MCACADHSFWTCLMVQGDEGLSSNMVINIVQRLSRQVCFCNCTAIVTGSERCNLEVKAKDLASPVSNHAYTQTSTITMVCRQILLSTAAAGHSAHALHR